VEVILLIIIVIVGWRIFVQVAAHRQVSVALDISELEASQVTMAYFGSLWNQVPGPGQLNFQPRLRANAPTISIDFEPDGVARCAVQVWTSGYFVRYFIMAHAQLMWRKKRGLIRRLTQSGA
jgi:hypothetical protein